MYRGFQNNCNLCTRAHTFNFLRNGHWIQIIGDYMLYMHRVVIGRAHQSGAIIGYARVHICARIFQCFCLLQIEYK